MKEKLRRFSLCLLFCQAGLALVPSEKIFGEVGKKISLPCRDSRKEELQNIQWNKDGEMFVKYNKMGKSHGKAEDPSSITSAGKRFNVQHRTSCNLETNEVKLIDSGIFTCLIQGVLEKTVELIVFEVLAEPSDTLIMTENLTLSVKSSIRTFDVSWLKDGVKIRDGPSLEMTNVMIEQSGIYTCHIRMKDGAETRLSKTISVKGFKPTPTIVYMSGKQPITLPFIFNFKVRESPLLDGIRAVEGDIKYISSTNKTEETLKVTSGAACWPSKCEPKADPEDLSYRVLRPKSGRYHLEIVLQIANRDRRLQRDVCVTSLTVSTSDDHIVSESNVTLLCNVNCIGKDSRLCWHHVNKSYEICGLPGKEKLAKNITIVPETSGNWTCGVFTGDKRLASINLTLEMPLGFLSSPLFWVTVVVGVIVFLLIVTILTIMIARHRRVRRARYRAWLIENLHHHRRCECDYKGFSPQRLRHNV
ncbi:uncharacterized protein LOC142182858 [Leptodactylus fuscus]|uniref:uncharacterized protein LOC142182858 n=1 Tax=Leptodactylus fuscus TaxID=238119 RepID=UPI003F4F1EA3